MRAITSAKLTPHAATSMRTQPGRSAGSGRSTVLSTPCPPCLAISIACIAYEITPSIRTTSASAQRDAPTGDEANACDDLIDHLARHLRVGRDDHCRQPLLILVGGVADRGGGDVDAVRAEARADAADHAGEVGVAEHAHVRRQLDRQTPTLHLDQVWHAVGADASARG